MAVAFCVTGFANTTIFAAIDEGLGRGSSFFGVLAAIQGGGSVLGGITAAAVIRRARRDDGRWRVGLAMLGAGLGRHRRADDAHRDARPPSLVGVPIPWTMVAFTTLRQRLDAGAGCRAGCRRRRTWR